MLSKCPDCGAKNLFFNRQKGEVICRACAFVIDDSLPDFGRERMLDSDDVEKKSRSGAPYDPRIANNIITEIGSYSDLNKLPSSSQRLFKRIKSKNRWTSSAIEHNLNRGLANLNHVGSFLKLPNHVEKEAARIYRECAERGLTRARSMENMVAGAVYIAAKVNGIPKRLDEISTATGIDVKTIAKSYKLIIRNLNIKLVPTSPVDFIPKFASELGLSQKVQTATVKMLESLLKMKHASGKNPSSLGATCLYLNALIEKEKVKQKQICEIAGITETTLRNRCKDLVKLFKLGNKFRNRFK